MKRLIALPVAILLLLIVGGINGQLTQSGGSGSSVNLKQVSGTTTAVASTVGDANAGGGVQTIQPSLFNGATFDRALTCPNSVIVDDSTMGNTQIIAASGATRVKICKMTLTTAAGVSIQLTQGTGLNCVTGNANLSGLYQNASTVAEDFVADQSALSSATSQAVCLNLGAATRTTGQIQYVQF
jgi:hypothetical protein